MTQGEVGRRRVASEPSPTRRALGRVALVLLVLLCGLTLLGGYLNKARCAGPQFDQWGRSQPDYKERTERDACYSDIQHLWIGRDIDRHVFPYIGGRISPDGELSGGAIEYPVLTGLLIWVGANRVHTDAGFLLVSALLLAPFGLLTAWLLGRMSGWRALLWAVGPPLVLYAFHNWDLPVVACAVAAGYVVHRGWGRRGADRPLVQRATAASVLLAVGFCLKLYPAIFVPPLVLYVATGGAGGRELPAGRRYDLVGAVRVAAAAVVTAVLINLPFALLGGQGWLASFDFQRTRRVDITTNSIWFWGLRPYSDPSNLPFQQAIGVVSAVAVAGSFLLACALGWRRYRREGSYPWIQVSAAMLCGFLLLYKVHSPQYTLWLVPMFVLLRIRLGWVIGYLLADAAMGIGIFRWYWEIEFGRPSGIYDSFAAQAVVIGVWGRAALLAGLFFAFLAARSTVERDRPVPPGVVNA
ncbi:glycosyltransferase family 87 protein [Gandjariella thermophila]|uniref:glycosyltransferase family 87 protein n=1 Tax=Gandjariella thermophila TaxID=1931992 RepID=UPI0026D48ABC